MSDQIKELLDVPRDFLRDGTQLLNRCTKPDRREFVRISQAVGVGFVVMGAIGYFVKLSELISFSLIIAGERKRVGGV